MSEARWWDGMTSERLHGSAVAALAALDRLTLGRLYGLPDDARGLIGYAGPSMRGRDADGFPGSHSVSFQPEDGRALTILSGRSHFADGMTFRARDGSLPRAGTPEHRANALVAGAVERGAPPVADPAAARAWGDRRVDTAACVVPFGVDGEKVWVRASEIAFAIGREDALPGLSRPDRAMVRFVNRHLGAVRQPVFANGVATGDVRPGVDGASLLLESFGTRNAVRSLTIDPRVVAATPGGAEELLAVRPVSLRRDLERQATRTAVQARTVRQGRSVGDLALAG